jgi:hypothetical protein
MGKLASSYHDRYWHVGRLADQVADRGRCTARPRG